MALKDNIGTILEYIESNMDTIEFNDKMFEIYEGDLLTYVKKALADQLSRRPFEEAKERIPGINILRKVVQKLSTLYNERPSRVVRDDTSQQLVDWYTKEGSLNTHMQDANQFFNLFKNCAIEPYVVNGLPKFRIIPANQFLVFSDDRVSPTSPTAFIKFMGTRINKDNKKVNVYWIYTDTEFLAIDADGTVVSADMADNPEGINPVGKIPFVYVNKSRYKIVPNPDTDMLSMTLLMPILLADLNFAAKYQTFSIVYGIDLDTDNLELNPNAIWNFKSDPQGIKPEIGTLKPEADITEMLASIQTQLGMWFESKNLRASTVGVLQPENASSGIALMIQNLDATEDRKIQTGFFRQAEDELWDLLGTYLHPYWTKTGQIKDKRQFSEDRVNVIFPEQKVIKTEQEAVEMVVRKLNEGLTTREMALRELHPDLPELSLQAMLAQIEREQSIQVMDFDGESTEGGDQNT